MAIQPPLKSAMRTTSRSSVSMRSFCPSTPVSSRPYSRVRTAASSSWKLRFHLFSKDSQGGIHVDSHHKLNAIQDLTLMTPIAMPPVVCTTFDVIYLLGL